MNGIVSSQENISKEPVIRIVVINKSKNTGVITSCSFCSKFIPVVFNSDLEFIPIDCEIHILIVSFLGAAYIHEAWWIIIVFIQAFGKSCQELVTKTGRGIHQTGSSVVNGRVLVSWIGVFRSLSSISIICSNLHAFDSSRLPEELLLWHSNPSDVIFITILHHIDIVSSVIAETVVLFSSKQERNGFFSDLIENLQLFN